MSAIDVVRTSIDALLAVTLAPACAACALPLEHPGAGPVCAGCWSRVRLTALPCCDRCGEGLASWRLYAALDGTCRPCRNSASPVDRRRAVGPYAGTLRDIVHALKYDGHRSLGRGLAELMRTHCREMLDGVDLVVPVPLHRSRERERGFNQAAAIARHLGVPVVHALVRRRRTMSQTGLPADRRHVNVRGAFALRSSVMDGLIARLAGARETVSRRAVHDRCVLLVDDVATTGATLEACATALKAAGARDVRALTAARAEARSAV